MTREERILLQGLDTVLRSDAVRAEIYPIVERVRHELAASPNVQMTWEPIPLGIFGDALPVGIRSSWVFLIRADATTGAERHPNSHQRMMSFQGGGDLQVEDKDQKSESRPGESVPGMTGRMRDVAVRWQSNVLVSEPGAPLERRWISIPQNVWHQVVVPENDDWVVVSFHTVPAEELIEERPDSGGPGGTKEMLYLGKRELNR